MAELLRVTLHLLREDCPPLFDELASFPKGRRRTARLRTLTLLGLNREESIAKTQRPKERVDRGGPDLDGADGPGSAMEAAIGLFGPLSGGSSS